jgi:hypothetical protein
MAQKIKTALPRDLDLGGAYIIEWDAVDPTTGDSVAGVMISDTSLGVAGTEEALAAIGNPLLIGAGVSI